MGLSRYDVFRENVFPADSFYVLETLGYFGCMFYIFLIGVKMDLSIVMRSSQKEKIIGILTFLVPMTLNLAVALILKRNDNEKWFVTVGVVQSTTSFQVIACFLADHKILNTDMGRLATSASTISGICSWISLEIMYAIKQNEHQEGGGVIYFLLSALVQIIFIACVLRKMVISIIRKTPPGEQVKELHLLYIFIMILGTGLVGESCGQHFLFGPIILGLAIPDGPPVGTALADKMDCFTSVLLLPVYFSIIGVKIDVRWRTSDRTVYVTLGLSLLGFVGKLVGAVIPCFFYQIPPRDALTLGLTLSALGLLDIQTYTVGRLNEVIPLDVYPYLILHALILAGIISPIVHFLYQPSRSYRAHKRRTIQDAKRNDELRIMICIYNQENVPSILKILEASNATRESPIVVYLLHLVELLGRSTPLLIAHKPRDKINDKPTDSDHIINSFKIYEKQNQGVAIVQPFTAITPLVTAHNDVCTVAIEKRTYFIIVPFHKQWNIDGTTQSSKWRNTNKKVLDKAPCSVGILIDRGGFSSGMLVVSKFSAYRVGVIFLGGADDREAVFYAMRMAEHPNVHVTVHHVIPVNNSINNVIEKRVDGDVMNECRLYNTSNQRCVYKEHPIKDGVQIVSLVRNLQDAYELILVGRRHSNYSALLSAFTEWTEYPELGFFGDMFASNDFQGKVAVLVIQQQSSASIDVIPGNSGEA